MKNLLIANLGLVSGPLNVISVRKYLKIIFYCNFENKCTAKRACAVFRIFPSLHFLSIELKRLRKIVKRFGNPYVTLQYIQKNPLFSDFFAVNE